MSRMAVQSPRILPHLQPFRLFDLPTEIRDQILEIHFFGSSLADQSVCYRPNPFKTKNYNLLSVNKQLYQESNAVLDRGAVLHTQVKFEPWLWRGCEDEGGVELVSYDVVCKVDHQHVFETCGLPSWPQRNRTKHFHLEILGVERIWQNFKGVYGEIFVKKLALEGCKDLLDYLRNECQQAESLTIQLGFNRPLELAKALEPLLSMADIKTTVCFADCALSRCQRKPCQPCRSHPHGKCVCGGNKEAIPDEERQHWTAILAKSGTRAVFDRFIWSNQSGRT